MKSLMKKKEIVLGMRKIKTKKESALKMKNQRVKMARKETLFMR